LGELGNWTTWPNKKKSKKCADVKGRKGEGGKIKGRMLERTEHEMEKEKVTERSARHKMFGPQDR